MDRLSLMDLEQLPGEVLTPEQVATVLEMNPHTIRVHAGQDPDVFGFPVMVIGTRVKIPKQPFLLYMRGESAKRAMDQTLEELANVKAMLAALLEDRDGDSNNF